MCTVTLIPLRERAASFNHADSELNPTGVRLACNRDELRTRPAALPPVIREFGNHKAIMPVDPASNGTWVAVSDIGIAATLLNVNAGLTGGGAHVHGRLSRGVLIPRLMAADSLGEAVAIGAAIDPTRHAPFRLIVLDRHAVADFYSDGQTLRQDYSPIADRPWLFTSSGLGDALVEPPRRALFNEMFANREEWQSQQEKFHRHAWPDRRYLSVCMERDEARTVSHTIVEIRPEQVTLTYVPGAPDQTKPLAPIELPTPGAST